MALFKKKEPPTFAWTCPVCAESMQIAADDVLAKINHAETHVTQVDGGAFWECSCGIRWRGNPGTSSMTGALALSGLWSDDH
jgi:hypothetical protein